MAQSPPWIPCRAQLYMGFMLGFYSIQRFAQHNDVNSVQCGRNPSRGCRDTIRKQNVDGMLFWLMS